MVDARRRLGERVAAADHDNPGGAEEMITAFLAKWGSKLLAALAVVATALGGLAMYGRGKKREGASREREKQRKQVQDNVEKAKRGRDRIRSDPSERDRLRKRRTRD